MGHIDWLLLLSQGIVGQLGSAGTRVKWGRSNPFSLNTTMMDIHPWVKTEHFDLHLSAKHLPVMSFYYRVKANKRFFMYILIAVAFWNIKACFSCRGSTSCLFCRPFSAIDNLRLSYSMLVCTEYKLGYNGKLQNPQIF